MTKARTESGGERSMSLEPPLPPHYPRALGYVLPLFVPLPTLLLALIFDDYLGWILLGGFATWVTLGAALTAPWSNYEADLRRFRRATEEEALARIAYPRRLTQHYGDMFTPEVCERLELSLRLYDRPEAVRRLLSAFGPDVRPEHVDRIVAQLVAEAASRRRSVELDEVPASVDEVVERRTAAAGVAWTQRVEVAVSADQLCPFCQDALRSEDGAVSCGACRTVLHRECFGELGGCPTVGCRNQARRRA